MTAIDSLVYRVHTKDMAGTQNYMYFLFSYCWILYEVLDGIQYRNIGYSLSIWVAQLLLNKIWNAYLCVAPVFGISAEMPRPESDQSAKELCNMSWFKRIKK